MHHLQLDAHRLIPEIWLVQLLQAETEPMSINGKAVLTIQYGTIFQVQRTFHTTRLPLQQQLISEE